MRTLKSLICTVCASMLLIGCSYFDAAEKPDVTTQTEQVDLTAQQPVEALAPADPLSNMSNSNVEVFSLDGPSGAAPTSNNGGVSTFSPGSAVPSRSSDPSVEVFPLDGGASWDTGISAPTPLTPQPVSAEPVASAGGITRVLFGHDSVELDSQAEQVVAGVAQNHGPGIINVEGHASTQSSIADTVQRKIVNLKISMDRALAVARRLIEGGVPAESIRTAAWGEVRPAESTEASRRVEISQ
jgi:outer membrane protein OmpA-like peptidoglycan-associated protein